MENIPEKIVPLGTKNVKEIMSEEIKQSRSLKLFENAIRSEYTRKNYSCTLKKFMISDEVLGTKQVNLEEIRN